LDSVHYGVPPKRRCDLYGGLEGQDAQRSRRQRGFQLELRSTWFSLRALFSYLSFLYLIFLCRRRRRYPLAVRLIVFAADPESVQQHRQLPRHGHHRSFLTVLASAPGEFQTKAA
jgi:hypothetical protein